MKTEEVPQPAKFVFLSDVGLKTWEMLQTGLNKQAPTLNHSHYAGHILSEAMHGSSIKAQFERMLLPFGRDDMLGPESLSRLMLEIFDSMVAKPTLAMLISDKMTGYSDHERRFALIVRCAKRTQTKRNKARIVGLLVNKNT